MPKNSNLPVYPAVLSTPRATILCDRDLVELVEKQCGQELADFLKHRLAELPFENEDSPSFDVDNQIRSDMCLVSIAESLQTICRSLKSIARYYSVHV